MTRLKIPTFIAAIAIIPLFSSFKISQDYDVKAFFNGIETHQGTMALCDDDFKEAKAVFLPIKLPIGKYTVQVTRISKDLYKVIDKNIYIQTRYCYEYANSETAALIVDGELGYSKGKIIF